MLNYIGRPEIGTNYNHTSSPLQSGRTSNPFEQKGRNNLKNPASKEEVGYFANLLK